MGGKLTSKRAHRYVNMMYTILSTIDSFKGRVLHSYDINC
jgi:hypothetical protein